MNKTKLIKINLGLNFFISHLYYLLLFIIAFFLIHNMVEYDSFVILCDNGGSSMDPFFMNDENQFNDSDKESKVLSDSASSLYNNPYCSNLLDKYRNIGKRKVYWFVTQKDKGNYTNYNEFKKS